MIAFIEIFKVKETILNKIVTIIVFVMRMKKFEALQYGVPLTKDR